MDSLIGGKTYIKPPAEASSEGPELIESKPISFELSTDLRGKN